MAEFVRAFTDKQAAYIETELAQLALILASLPGAKLEENNWAYIYRRAKGYDGVPTWSNLPFRDFLEDGLGVESKLLRRKNPAGDVGKAIMHPAATRTLEYDPTLSAEECKKTIITQWAASIELFTERTRETSTTGDADLRWGILLWAVDYTQYLYFEERIDVPQPDDFTAEWIDRNHRGKPTRTLAIRDAATDSMRYSVTLPKNGAKLQPYFTVPTVEQGAHLFKIDVPDMELVALDQDVSDSIQLLVTEQGVTASELLRQLLQEQD